MGTAVIAVYLSRSCELPEETFFFFFFAGFQQCTRDMHDDMLSQWFKPLCVFSL